MAFPNFFTTVCLAFPSLIYCFGLDYDFLKTAERLLKYRFTRWYLKVRTLLHKV